MMYRYNVVVVTETKRYKYIHLYPFKVIGVSYEDSGDDIVVLERVYVYRSVFVCTFNVDPPSIADHSTRTPNNNPYLLAASPYPVVRAASCSGPAVRRPAD